MIFTKKQKELALSLSHADLLNEYMQFEYKLKYFLFCANKKEYKKQKRTFKNLRKAMLFQNTEEYSKKIARLSKNG